ncbi:MAG: hypothetical protein IPL87_01160 [Candidatus Moraniibacteriota bacterium]|nr:MAG: hypothetical protein IPL87_01160 [Candidatus Moranbacteria bacterium]
MKEELKTVQVLKAILKVFSWEREPSLLSLVKEEKKLRKDHKELINSKLTLLWLSGWEILAVVLVLAFFFVLSHSNWINGILHQFNNICCENLSYWIENKFSNLSEILREENHFQNLITIHAGIGAVLIGLAFFIAQEIANENPYRGRILLKRSKFFPLLIIAEVLYFLYYIWWGNINFFGVIPLVLIAAGTIYSLFQTLNLFSNNFSFKKERKEFLHAIKIRFLNLLDNEVTQLIGDGVLNKKLKRFKKVVEVSPFSPVNKNRFIPIKTLKTGTFYDFKLNKLNSFLLRFQKRLPEDYSALLKNSDEVSNTDEEYKGRDPYFWIVPRYLSYLEKGEGNLLWIHKDLIKSPSEKAKVSEMANKLFVIKRNSTDYDEIQNEISEIKLRCYEFIQQQKTKELGEITDFYIELIKEFYSYLEQHGGGFSAKQASDMRFEIAFGGFKSVSWISKDISEVIENGLSSVSKDINRYVMYLPIRLLQEAIDHKDHLIFQEFAYYPLRFYHIAIEAKRKNDETRAAFIFDRIWRYLNDLSRHPLEEKLEDKNYSKEEIKLFAEEILKIFQSLLKASFSNRDTLNFQKFLLVTSKLFKDIRDSGRSDSDEDEKLYDYLDGKRKEMFFGVASWILYELEQDKDNEKVKEFYDEVKRKLPSEINDFTKLFSVVHDFAVESFWGWDNWEMEGQEEGEAHTIDILSKLERLYAVYSLEILKEKTPDEIAGINLPHSRDLAYLAEGTRSLLGTLEDMKANPSNWSFLLDGKALEKVDSFKDLLVRAKESQENEEIDKKRRLRISPKKVAIFKKSVVKDFYDNDQLRSILRHYSLFQDKSNEPYSGDLKSLGVNTLFDKAGFFDDSVSWHVHVLGMEEGFEFGRNMVIGENTDLLKKIKDRSAVISAADLDQKIADISTTGEAIIIAVNNASWRSFFEANQNEKYTPKWRLNIAEGSLPKEINGFYKVKDKDIPVYELYDNKRDSYILVLNKNRLGILTQYSPLEATDSESLKIDIFKINVQEFLPESELMKKFLQNPPDWLSKEGSQKNQENYLMERILIHVFERFEFNLQEDFEGFLIKVREN